MFSMLTMCNVKSKSITREDISTNAILKYNKHHSILSISSVLPHAVCSSFDSPSQVISQTVASPGAGLILLSGHITQVLPFL